MNLNKKKLRQILNQINSNRHTKELYESKWHRMYHFLLNNTGLKIAEVGRSGSQAKLTNYKKGDLDIIFRTAQDQNRQQLINMLVKKAKILFGAVAKIKKSKVAVHADFSAPRCCIDLVYLHKKKYNLERKKIMKIKQISQLRKDSIKLAKYALDKACINTIHGYEVEKCCLNFNYSTLEEYTLHNIKQFTGRIKKKGLNLDQVLRFLR